MKKIVLSIFGIFALVACSEDVYHDIDKQNNGLETGVFPNLQKFPYTVGGSTYNYEVELITYSTPGPSMSVLSLKIIP